MRVLASVPYYITSASGLAHRVARDWQSHCSVSSVADQFCLYTSTKGEIASDMSSSGPSADAKKAQAAALEELEAAQKKKRTLDGQLVGFRLGTFAYGRSCLP